MKIGSALERALWLSAGVVALSAGVVAIAAVAITLYEARIEREHQKVSVWPYASQANSDSGHVYRCLVANVGLGPALVRSFQVSVNGRPMRSWGNVLTALVPAADSAAAARTSYSSLGRGSVLLPGSRLELLLIPDSVLGRKFHMAIDHLRGRICYCSLYDDCWMSDSEADEPTPIAACPDEPKREFAQ